MYNNKFTPFIVMEWSVTLFLNIVTNRIIFSVTSDNNKIPTIVLVP